MSANPQMQKHVADLRRLIQLQNRVILGLSLLFVLVVVTTVALINTAHFHHPNDDHTPFWEQTGQREKSKFGPDRKPLRSQQQQQHQQQQQQQQQQGSPRVIKQQGGGQQQLARNTKKQTISKLEVSKCRYMYFGCPLLPLEITQLNSSDARTSYYYPSLASTSHIMITHRSNRVKPAPVNQDRVVLMPSYLYSMYQRSKSDIISAINDPQDDFFVGIFDGHGDNGHKVSKFASEEIPARLASKMMANKYEDDKEKSITKDMIVEVFKEVDRLVTINDGGSTASIALRIGQRLYMANTGDSTAFICIYRPPDYYDKYLTGSNKAYIMKSRDGRADASGNEEQQLYLQGTVAIHYQNTRHKPHLPLEKSRIEEHGGRVHVPRNPEGSRVIVHENAGLHRGEDVGLAMSRSIGDRDWKAVGVIPDPDVVVIDLEEFWSVNDIVDDNEVGKRVFVVLGSDGLFDVRKVEYVASHLAYGLFEWGQGWGLRKEDRDNEELQAVFSNHLLGVGKKLVNMATPLKEGVYRDDISFIARRIELQE
ncbi:hypothetical protein ACHAW5_011085 [Stephanodiscus triporus]|uniref:PPM-type phosphatase domain-containing protein n=1 Tax=Stephanodiscus triporus TaxID=2934178 RepID=A0ABD3QLT6_9STRA